jgi:tetratricopeptide (TPR) repeat protein
MSFWKKLFGEETGTVDYYREGVELQRTGNYHEALTSFRLALRDAPLDPAVLQQMAITYTRIGMTDEAAKTYRTVLSSHPGASGAHYGLAFLLLRQGQAEEAEKHLRAFLDSPPDGADAQRHVEHARTTLEQLQRGVVPGPDP